MNARMENGGSAKRIEGVRRTTRLQIGHYAVLEDPEMGRLKPDLNLAGSHSYRFITTHLTPARLRRAKTDDANQKGHKDRAKTISVICNFAGPDFFKPVPPAEGIEDDGQVRLFITGPMFGDVHDPKAFRLGGGRRPPGPDHRMAGRRGHDECSHPDGAVDAGDAGLAHQSLGALPRAAHVKTHAWTRSEP
jgi:hypothetical protein